jgi:hypothetical protein
LQFLQLRKHAPPAPEVEQFKNDELEIETFALLTSKKTELPFTADFRLAKMQSIIFRQTEVIETRVPFCRTTTQSEKTVDGSNRRNIA